VGALRQAVDRLTRCTRGSAAAAAIVLAALVSVAAADAGSVTAGSGRTAARSADEPTTIPVPEKRPAGWIAIDKVSNGCGGGALIGLQNWIGDTATYGSGNPFEPVFKVSFREACNLHDAAYSGALVWDGIHGAFTDFRSMTQKEADDKMQADMNLACNAQIPPKYDKLREECKAGVNHYRLVRVTGALNFRDRNDLSGAWANQNPGWPLCDIGAHPWTIKQTGREVTVTWLHGSGQAGSFKGVLITGDKLTDDRIVGEYTLSGGGQKPTGGPMTFAVTGEDTFDFNGTGVPGGKMVRKERATQGASGPHVCKRSSPPATTTTPATAAGTFVLTSTKVTNPNAPELVIDANGQKATWNHCCDGGKWTLDFSWKVPQTMAAGKASSITIGMHASGVQPDQPILFQMSARAPDFAQALDMHYPSPSSATKTYTVPLAEDLKDSKEVFVVIAVVSAEITYTYRRSGG
jgi:hypothetical protein